jgi:ribosome-binding protein aMBF1 (putative translation factor)
MSSSFNQDFKEIVFSKNKSVRPSSSRTRVEISKVHKELLNDEDIPKLKMFGKDNGKILQSARVGKQLTQEQLAVQVNERKNVINQYELGNIVPDNSILNKLRRVLNVKFN